MLRKIAFSLLVVLLVGIFTISVFAAPEKSKLQTVLDRGYLIVGTGSVNVPWHFMDEKGELNGFDIDIARILAVGLFDDPTKVKFVEQAADARIANLLTDKVDIVIQFMTITPLRSQQVAFSIPYYTEGVGLILPASGKYKNHEEMVAAIKSGETIRVAARQDVYAEQMAQEALEGSVCEQYETHGLLYQAINSHRAEAACVDLSSILWLASSEPDKYLDSGRAFYPQLYGAAMRPDDQIWINFVNSVLLDAMTGRSFRLYNDAFAKWFGVKLPEPKIGKPEMYR